MREPDGSERDLTPGREAQGHVRRLERATSRAFFVLTNERDPQFFDLYRYDADGYERTLVYKNEAGYQLGDVSRDGRWIALRKPNTTADSDLYLYDVARPRA